MASSLGRNPAGFRQEAYGGGRKDPASGGKERLRLPTAPPFLPAAISASICRFCNPLSLPKANDIAVSNKGTYSAKYGHCLTVSFPL